MSRREQLLSQVDQGTPVGRIQTAEFLYDTGAYAQALNGCIEILEMPGISDDIRMHARAAGLRCRAEFALGKGRDAKRSLDEFEAAFGASDDLYARAVGALVQGAYRSGGATGESDAFERATEYFRTAAGHFEELGDFDLAIFCLIELSAATASRGKYLSAINKIEEAMCLSQRHSALYYTGRMLTVGASAAADQGYRKAVESTLLRAIEWCEFVGDFWGRLQGLYALARILSYKIPTGDPQAASQSEGIFLGAIEEAESHGAVGLAAHLTASLAWLYQKSGETEKRQRLIDKEDGRSGGRRKHFDGMFTNSGEVVKTANVRLASRLQDGIESHPDAFFIFDARRDVGSGEIDFLNEYRNEVGAKMLGLDDWAVFLYSEAQESAYLQGLTEPLLKAVESRATFQDTYRMELDGESHWFARRVVPSGDGAILVVRDVTAEQRIESALRSAAVSAEQSDRSKSEFLANMSHEIRTPINGVLGLARLLADTKLDPDQRAYVEDIIGSGDILISVIGNILDLSKMESFNMSLDVRPCVLEDIVQSTVRLFRGQASEKGIELSATIENSSPVAILTDGARLRQVLANLIGNAVKFTSRGSVSVLVRRESDELRIEVADTGMGIQVDRIDTIFDRFQQASAESRILGGTGLGLTISKGIVELMGGSISVDSRPGVGSRFVIRLPVTETSEESPRSLDSLPLRIQGARILVVDDNRVNRMVSRYSLEKLGGAVTVAGNGAEALELCEDGEFELIFMDIRMPVLNGLEATRELRIREEGSGKRTPVVALTAGALLEERDECLRAGMDDYISKPFSDDLLGAVLARLLPKHRAVNQKG